MRGLFLFLISFLLGLLLLPILFFYSWFHNVKNRINTYAFFFNNSITIDFLGNINGELIEHYATWERHTMFGMPKVTISESLGELQHSKLLLPRGLRLVKKIDKAFNLATGEVDHCLNAYYTYYRKNGKKHFRNLHSNY